MKEEIEKAIRKAINRHLVTHIQTPGDTRCRIDILVEEAAVDILKHIEKENNNTEELHEK